MSAQHIGAHVTRRDALVGLLRLGAGPGLGLAVGLSPVAQQAHAATDRSAAEGTERRLRFEIQLHNPLGTPVPSQPLWFCGPLSRSGTQTLLSMSSSQPFQRRDEWGDHTLLHWQTPALPPHGVRAFTLDVLLRLSDPGAPMAATVVPGQSPSPDIAPGSFLRPERFMESDEPAIVALAHTLRRPTSRATVRAIYDWVRSQLSYAGYVADDLGAAQALHTLRGDCTEYAYLVVALCRALGLPARALGGFVVDHDAAPRATEYHNWAEVHLDGAWRLVDAQREAMFDDPPPPHSPSHHVAFRLIGDRPVGPLGQAHRFSTDGPAQVRLR